MQSNVVGIDLGTTFSSIAFVTDIGEPTIIPNAEGQRITPSAVYFDEAKVLVGQTAKNQALTNPDKVVLFIKRQMGNPYWYFQYGEQRLSPIDIAAMIIKKLKQDAEERLGAQIQKGVITVPAYFDDAHRRATISAGQTSGLEEIDVINEPTAAAIAFNINNHDTEERLLIYDLGGGTFDVTALNIKENEIKVLATTGNHQLGGKDFDDLLIGMLASKFHQNYGFDPTKDLRKAAEIRLIAERAKYELSDQHETIVIVQAMDKTAQIQISRQDFEVLIKPKVENTLSLIRLALEEAHLDRNEIDRVLLVGGSTRVPLIRRMLQEFFSKEPDSSINPDEVVALGAALVAARRTFEIEPESLSVPVKEIVGPLQISDVTSHSIGIETTIPGTNQKINSILIPRQSPLPFDVSREFVTALTGQTAIKMVIYQGEFQKPELCNPIGEFTLSGLPPGRPPGKKVRVTIRCDVNGIVNITAMDIESGKKVDTQVSYKSGVRSEDLSAKAAWLKAVPIT